MLSSQSALGIYSQYCCDREIVLAAVARAISFVHVWMVLWCPDPLKI